MNEGMRPKPPNGSSMAKDGIKCKNHDLDIFPCTPISQYPSIGMIGNNTYHTIFIIHFV